MEIRFYKDPETGLSHVSDHGITEDEVVEILALAEDVQRGDNDSLIAMGQTLAGRYLRVIYVPDRDEPNNVFIVTAYPLTSKQFQAFRRRRRKRR